MDLRDEVGLVRRNLSAQSKAQALALGKLLIGIWLVKCAGRSMREIESEIATLAVSNTGSSLGELALIGIESYRTLRVIISKSFGFGEAEADLRGGVVR